MEKFLKVGKLNSFPILNSFNGNALLIYANNKNNYAINVSAISGSDALKVSSSFPVAQPGEELIIDGQEINIKIESDNIDSFNGGLKSWNLKAKYGVRGDKGLTGQRGLKGDQGPSAFEANDIDSDANTIKIANNIETDENDALLSALQGNILKTFINKHDESVMKFNDYSNLTSKVTDRVYYTIEEEHNYTGKKYTMSGTINWDIPVSDDSYDININANGDLYISSTNAHTNNGVLTLNKDLAEVNGSVLTIKKSKSIVGDVGESVLSMRNVSIMNSQLTIKSGSATINNGILTLKK